MAAGTSQYQPIVMGHEAVLKINDTVLAVRNLRAGLRYDTFSSKVTGDGAFKTTRRDNAVLEVSWSFQENEDIIPHAEPYLMGASYQEFVDVKVYPKGLLFEPYHSPTFLIATVPFTANAESGPGERNDIGGESSGEFTYPTT